MSGVARPAICLNMIVRNEAHIVREVLDAVAPYITSWVIVDTGSQDGTQELIRDHMASLGIPGELHERPWRDFGHNRSEALTLAKGHGDYIWVMDADDTVVGTPDFTGLSADAYLMHIRSAGYLTYWRRQLFRDGMRWHYVGVIHEYAHCKDPYVEQRLDGEYYIESRRLGGRNLDPQKNERDADLLLAEVERNPDDARSVLHLAQTYADLGDFANARRWAARRAEMGGWDEELYHSSGLVAESMLQLGEPWPQVQDAYLSAWEFRPTRAEPLYAIASAYRADHRYRLGHLFARLAAELPFPEEDLLFVRADIYNWRALDEQAICAAGLGKHEEAFTLCRRLLARRDIPDEDRKRIAANRDTVAATMIDAATPYPDMLAGSLVTGPDRAATQQTRPAICLNMIVRNEAHIVREVLDAVAPYITSWVIVDTGSQDGTRELIRGHMASLGIPGELHERPWRDFGHNRSEALTLAKGRGDYIWVMDADDTVVGTPDFTGLSADAYLMRICDSDTFCTYWRRQLFRDGMRWHYVGVIHEYAHCKDPYGEQRLDGEYYIESRRLGGRNLDPQKYERDADLLLAEVERNPDDARSVFLLAQSYFNQGDFANARRWDVRRAEMGGWDEELYYSICRLADSMLQLGEPWPQVQDAYLSAWEFRPTRAEPLYAIASAYRAAHRYRLGHLFARLAAELPFPEEDLLFVRADIYNWRALDEQAVCAAGLGKHEEAFTLCRRLLARRGIPDEDRKRIAANRDTVAATMIDAATPYPDMLAGSLVTGPPDCEVTVSLIAGSDRAATEQTLNSFLRCCTDVSRVGRFLVLDAGLSAPDREALLKRYRFLEFGPCTRGDAPGAQLADLRSQIQGRFWLDLGQGWRFFAPDTLISRMTAILDAEPEVFQVGINVDDAQELTGACAPEDAVHRIADAGRYVPAAEVARGPAMFETARLDRAGGIDVTDHDPITELGRRAAAAGLHPASLDEVLCIAKLTSEESATARTDSDSWDLASSVGATATMAAAARALATQLRFIDDPFAAPLVRAVGLDFATRLVDGDIPNVDPQHTAQGMAVRTRFFDHFFLDAGRAGIRQAVILASGLDARVYRLPWPHGTVVYEVDVPEVIEFKTTTLAGLGAEPKAALRIVAVDLRGDWPRALREAGFATDRPAAWIAEGVLVYLPPDAQDALFDHITALSAPGSRLATEFLPDPNVLLDQRSMELHERLRAAGFGLDFKELVFDGKRSNVVDYLAGHRWSVVSSRTVEQLLAEHGFTYPDDQSARPYADQRFVSAVLSA